MVYIILSTREDSIIKILGKRKMTIKEISEELFKDHHPNDRPFDAEISVGNSIRRIIEKCEHYAPGWTLIKERKGNRLLIRKEKV
jgi:hypothetical protein